VNDVAASTPNTESTLDDSSINGPLARTGVPILASAEQLATIKYAADGLVATIVQERSTHEVLMVAYMDQEALRRTCESGRTWFYSRSREEYWLKGETSGERQFVHEIFYDCDGDALLIIVDQEGQGACHTGNHSCFYRRFGTE
jgi:phosphoribosyl-AMP cyclohydrolase